MNIIKNIKVPTGNILVVQGERGNLEMLSLADYGKGVNVKCDAMGLTREPSPVKHTALLPLEDKWVITVSTQYGCSMGCNFCDVPKVKFGGNATKKDLVDQVFTGLSLHPEVVVTKRLNIHYARMGEPTFNPNVLSATKRLHIGYGSIFNIHPVVSTMMPKNNHSLALFILYWMSLKNDLMQGNAGLQLSINSTDEAEREVMFNGNACSLVTIAEIMKGIVPEGRKITLNFIVANYTVDPEVLLNYFDPEHYIIKLTPMHKTNAATANGIKTKGNYTQYYPYKKLEESLVNAGYDVLVFIASKEEDASRITCGNAVLAGAVQ